MPGYLAPRGRRVLRGFRLAHALVVQFIINASTPASDKIFDVPAFEKFLHERIKVDGRTGNLGDTIKISQQGEGKIEILAHNDLSGRYLKYLYVPLSRRVRTKAD